MQIITNFHYTSIFPNNLHVPKKKKDYDFPDYSNNTGKKIYLKDTYEEMSQHDDKYHKEYSDNNHNVMDDHDNDDSLSDHEEEMFISRNYR